ncbi:hypothetical protein NEF87_004859 [Candidatus Lokiarchaeum ossiferum]|uniref:PIN domain-containing protein n=1 Tax=Candidatus Lokiarchaeum ossiferum TaxID=2951803 RepID=A0ABY6I180_9ARCH|nr:hypothetical protein NEF87_004859 [Candidatus Lokiarchaeum sp. B-35]
MVFHCLDAGVLSLYFLQNTPKEFSLLMELIKTNPANTFIAKEILLEVFKHLCVLKGHNYAESVLQSFYRAFDINFVDLSHELIVQAGRLKCQHRAKLSYNDCIAIAIALQKKATFHTTEKILPKIPHLHVKSYLF